MAYSVTLINGVVAFLWIVLGIVVGKIVGNIVKRFLKNSGVMQVLSKELQVKFPLENTLAGMVKYFFYSAGLIYGLNQLGVSTRVLEIAFGVFLLLILIFLILAVKDYIPNIIAGIYIVKTQKLKRGDHVRVKSIAGEIMQIGMVETQIKTKDEIVFVPNIVLNKSEVVKKEAKA